MSATGQIPNILRQTSSKAPSFPYNTSDTGKNPNACGKNSQKLCSLLSHINNFTSYTSTSQNLRCLSQKYSETLWSPIFDCCKPANGVLFAGHQLDYCLPVRKWTTANWQQEYLLLVSNWTTLCKPAHWTAFCQSASGLLQSSNYFLLVSYWTTICNPATGTTFCKPATGLLTASQQLDFLQTSNWTILMTSQQLDNLLQASQVKPPVAILRIRCVKQKIPTPPWGEKCNIPMHFFLSMVNIITIIIIIMDVRRERQRRQ